MSGPTVNVLPLWQPWATLVAIGAKRVETRHWSTPRRLVGQPLAIYATKNGLSMRDERALLDDILFHDALRELVPGVAAPTSKAIADVLPRGALLATCVIDRCVQIDDKRAEALAERNPRELAFGDYTPGRYGWVIRDVCQLEQPVFWHGEEEDGWKPRQGIFTVPAEVVGLAPPQEKLPIAGASS